MKELIQKLLQLHAELRTNANAALKTLPPIEQFEANQELSYGLRCMRNMGQEMAEQLERLNKWLTADTEGAFAAAEKAVLSAAIAAGDVLPKADHEAAITAARDGAAKATADDLTAKFEAQLKAAGKRNSLLKDLPTVVAEKIPDAVLLSAEAGAAIETIKARLNTLAGFGTTAETAAEFVAEVATLPTDAAGTLLFDTRTAPIRVAFQASKPASGKTDPVPPNPAAGAGTPSSEADSLRFL